MKRSRKRVARALALLASMAFVAAMIAGCGGSSTPAKGGSATAGSAGTAASAATVKTAKVPGYGTVLVTASGKALYMLTADSPGASSCTGSCVSQWPPLTVHGAPSAGPGANKSLLSTFKRSGGTEQVAYNKHALYTHAGNVSAASEAGIASDGGIWYLVSPSGKAIKSTTSGGY